MCVCVCVCVCVCLGNQRFFWHSAMLKAFCHVFDWVISVAAPALKNPREMGGGDFDVIFQSKGIPN